MTEESGRYGIQPIEQMIMTIRGQRVILDADLARIYGVPTRRLNEQVRRNADRFPPDFAFVLTELEIADLKSQIAISSHEGNGRNLRPVRSATVIRGLSHTLLPNTVHSWPLMSFAASGPCR